MNGKPYTAGEFMKRKLCALAVLLSSTSSCISSSDSITVVLAKQNTTMAKLANAAGVHVVK